MNPPLQLNAVLRRAAVNDRKSQEMIYRQFYVYAREIARRYGRPEQETDQIVENSFLELFDGLKTFDPSAGSFKTFLKNIVVDNGINNKTITYVPTVLASLKDWEKLAPGDTENKLRSLPAGVHAILLLSAVEGFNNLEIAQRLGIKEQKNLIELQQLTNSILPYHSIIQKKIQTLPPIASAQDISWPVFELVLTEYESSSKHSKYSTNGLAGPSSTIPEPIDPVEGQWTGWAFLIILIAASLVMLYMAGIIR